MTRTNLIDKLTSQIIKLNPDFEELDSVYVKNKIIALVGDDFFSVETDKDTLKDLIFELTNDKVLQSLLFDLATPKPSTINHEFWKLYQQDPNLATEYFHNLSIKNDYLKVEQIAKNIKFETPTEYGNLEITINLSKPEKTTKDIIKNKEITRKYPICPICLENEGYKGGNGYPTRSQHRVIRLELNKEPWFMQYSPYEYFDEHTIVINEKHVPMHIAADTFEKLFDFVDLFPQYLIGSNAGLPIIGGSLLGHEHFQGGKHIFPVEQSTDLYKIPVDDSDIDLSIVNWPVSTLRLKSKNRAKLSSLGNKILDRWMNYNNDNLQIYAEKDGQEHHSANPIVRRVDDEYVLLLMLRDNNVSDKYPDGIFHVHPKYQHIKQENIGLIEAMGLAILPGRLKLELEEIKQYILGNTSSVKDIHQEWATEIKSKYDGTNIDDYLDKNLGLIFKKILENTGVFNGQLDAFKDFIKGI